MLPFLKKKSEASAAPAVPNWHPNFRNFEKLPDIKVVRTAFFVNGAAVSVALALGLVLHGAWLAIDIAGIGRETPGLRLGFGPVLSLAAWLILAVYAVESRFVPLPAVRRLLAIFGAATMVLAWAFPGELRATVSRSAPLHWVLGVGSYVLFGAAVLHATMLDAAERQMRLRSGSGHGPLGMPLLRLEHRKAGKNGSTEVYAVSLSRHGGEPVLVADALRENRDRASLIDGLRDGVAAALAGVETRALPHEDVIRALDEAGRTFRILLLKTTLALPYTSVFLQLDCGYWNVDAESELRAAMKAAGAK